MRKVSLAVTGIGLLAFASLATATSAAAGPSSTNAAKPTIHCFANVDTQLTVCATKSVTIAQARVAAAGGAERASALIPVHVATLYQSLNYGGGSFEIDSATNCTVSKTNVDWTISNVGSGFNDETSSFRVYGNCKVQVLDLAGCPTNSAAYPTSGYAGTTGYVGAAMNDRTTCVRGS